MKFIKVMHNCSKTTSWLICAEREVLHVIMSEINKQNKSPANSQYLLPYWSQLTPIPAHFSHLLSYPGAHKGIIHCCISILLLQGWRMKPRTALFRQCIILPLENTSASRVLWEKLIWYHALKLEKTQKKMNKWKKTMQNKTQSRKHQRPRTKSWDAVMANEEISLIFIIEKEI